MGVNSKTYFGYGVCVIMYMFYPCFSFGNGSGIVRECFGNASLCHLYGVFRVLMTLDVISFCPTFGFHFFLRVRHAWDGQYLQTILTDRKEVILIQ